MIHHVKKNVLIFFLTLFFPFREYSNKAIDFFTNIQNSQMDYAETLLQRIELLMLHYAQTVADFKAEKNDLLSFMFSGNIFNSTNLS